MARFITAGIFILVLFAVAAGIYSFSYQGFRFLLRDTYFAEAIQLYIYELFFALIGFLVLGSAIVSGLRFMFRSEGDAWIMASSKFRILPPYALYQVCMASLWPIIIMAVPMLWGRLAASNSLLNIGSSSSGASLVLIGVSFLALIALTAGAVLAALVVILAAAQILKLIGQTIRRQVLTRSSLSLFAALAVLVLGLWAGNRVFNTDIVQLFTVYRAPLPVELSLMKDAAARTRLTEQVETATAATTDAIAMVFEPLPSHPVAEIVYASLNGGEAKGFWLNVAEVVGAICVLGILFWLLTRNYLILWQTLQEGHHRSRGRSTNWFGSVQSKFGALLRVEALRTFRNSQNILWLGFLLLLWFAQTGLNMLLRRNLARYHVAATDVPNTIQALQILTAVFFVSALVLRFVLPAFSAERKTAWITGSAPVSAGKLYLGKLGVYTILFGGLSLGIAFWNALVLGVVPSAWLPFLGFTLIAALTVTVVGLSCGAIFPNFETDDPETIATSLSGLTLTLGSLAYGGLAAWAYYQLTVFNLPGFAIVVLIVSVLSVLGFARLAIQSLRRMEFI